MSPESVKLDKTTLNLKVGETATLIPTVIPENTDDKSVEFTSSNTSIVTVTPKQGKVTAIATGSTSITAKTINGKTANCAVTITEEG
ncbi:Ig-like domain-containing protein [Enterococcus sp. AZ189]|uniref:Ig-like domain-containing protein n=1 Tax=Enterococcus sp. AZ189 TaxID=2774871 RepID=UPI003F68297E